MKPTIAALPYVGHQVPANLGKWIKNEAESDLQPTMAEVAEAFGIDPSMLTP